MTVLIGYSLAILVGMYVPWRRLGAWAQWRLRRPAPDFADYHGWRSRLADWRLERP